MRLTPHCLPHSLTLAALLAGCAQLEGDELLLDDEDIGHSEHAASDSETPDTAFSGDGKALDYVTFTRGALAVVHNPVTEEAFGVGNSNDAELDQVVYVRRLDPEGRLDTAVRFGHSTWRHAFARDATRQSSPDPSWSADDLIVAGGVGQGLCPLEGDRLRPCGKYPMVARLDDLGKDDTFSGDGVYLFSVGNYTVQEADAVAPYPGKDRRLAVAGRACWFPSSTSFRCQLFAARLTENGPLDTAYFKPGHGFNVAPVPSGYASEIPVDVAVQSGGHLIVVSHLLGPYGDPVATGIRRFLTNGEIDPAWGNSGIMIDSTVRGTSVATAGDGSLVVAGSSTAGYGLPVGDQMVATRYSAIGDRTYRRYVQWYAGRDTIAEDVTIDGWGRPVLAGWVKTTTGRHMAVARLAASGIPDPSFGDDGKILTSFTSGGSLATSVARSVRMMRHGGELRILVAGGLELWDDDAEDPSEVDNAYPDETYQRYTHWAFARYLAE
jgi:hypothetical protein